MGDISVMQTRNLLSYQFLDHALIGKSCEIAILIEIPGIMHSFAVPFAFEDYNKTVEEVLFTFVHTALYHSYPATSHATVFTNTQLLRTRVPILLMLLTMSKISCLVCSALIQVQVVSNANRCPGTNRRDRFLLQCL